jgi:hypothetical protein
VTHGQPTQARPVLLVSSHVRPVEGITYSTRVRYGTRHTAVSTVSVAFQGVADGLDAFLSQLVVAIEIQFGERVVGADHAGHVLAGLVAQVRTSTSRAQCRDAIVKSGIVTMVRSRFYRSRFYRSRFYRSRFHRSRFSSHGRTRRVCSMIEARVEILHYLPVAFHGFLSLKKGAR